MKAFMFPGQGAQRLGMGQDLFARFPDLTQQADEILGYSIAALCQEGPMEKLSQTQYTQPALYVVNSFKYLSHLEDSGEHPDYLLGHSVSEYAALFASGVVDFAAGLRLVAKRGALMSEAQGGGMAAVLGLGAEAVEDLLDGAGVKGAGVKGAGVKDVYPANFNTPKQVVVSGRKAAVVAAESLFLQAGATHYKVLAVSGAFHTPFMKEAQARFSAFVARETFAPQQVPVISNVTARPHVDGDIQARMIEHITAPVRWSESLRYLLAKGIEFADTVEIGPEGPPVVRPMFKRTQLEAGPLDLDVGAADGENLDVRTANGGAVERAGEGPPGSARFSMENLGSRAFCEAFALRYPYVSGSMYRGIASAQMVIRMAHAGLLGFFGAAGLPSSQIKTALQKIRAEIPAGATFGVNFIAHINRPHLEDELTDLLLEHGVTVVEASAFMEVTPALVRYRAKGLTSENGTVRATHKVIAKVSRPDVAAQFLSPAPKPVIEKLLQAKAISADEAAALRTVPMADAICVESDSGGHTDQGMPFALIPPILQLRDEAQQRFADFGPVFVGAAGGIGTPEAAAAVFILGADFIVTGSINQCTVEAGTSAAVKDLLQGINVYDTAYAPSGEMFELGSRVQVLKKGVFFPSRAEKLVALYRQHDGLDAIEPKLRTQIEQRYFGRGFDEVFADVARTYPASEVERAQRMPKHRMALVFKRYFRDTTDWALNGDIDHKVDFQVHCGPAQGAFNQWAAGGDLEPWRQRHVDAIGLLLLERTADHLNRRLSVMVR